MSGGANSKLENCWSSLFYKLNAPSMDGWIQRRDDEKICWVKIIFYLKYIGVQNTVNIITDISSSTHPPSLYWLFYVTMLLTTTSAPGATDSNCIWQPCFQRGCTKRNHGINCLLMFSLRTVCLCFVGDWRHSVHCRHSETVASA